MRARETHHPLGATALLLLLVALPACGGETTYDWKNREVPWTYGPTTGTATPEHLKGTGTKGPGAIAKGWQCRLADAKRLTVVPYELASSHSLFGKVKMNIGLFEESGKQLTTVRSGAITAEGATFTFEITEPVAKQLNDLVIWFAEL